MKITVTWRIDLLWEESFTAYTDTGGIRTDLIGPHWSDPNKVKVSGRALKKDGSLGTFNRTGELKVRALPRDLRSEVEVLINATTGLEK